MNRLYTRPVIAFRRDRIADALRARTRQRWLTVALLCVLLAALWALGEAIAAEPGFVRWLFGLTD